MHRTIEAYLAYLERGAIAAPRTVESYRNDLSCTRRLSAPAKGRDP